MSSLLCRWTALIPGKLTTYTTRLSNQEHKDFEHDAASAGASAQFNGGSLIQPNSKLIKFQNLVGIQSHRTIVPGRPAPNPDMYKRTVDEKAKAHHGYVLTTYMVNSFFLLQIIVGAALTALGAAGGPSAAAAWSNLCIFFGSCVNISKSASGNSRNRTAP